MSVFYENGRDRTAVDIQVGGPGNRWQVLDIEDGASLSAPSGGRQGVESDWGQSAFGQGVYLGARRTGNPDRFTFDLMARLKSITFLRGLLRDLAEEQACGCVDTTVNIRARTRCGDKRVLTNYDMALVYADAVSTSQGYDNPLAMFDEGDDMKVMESQAMSAGIEYRHKKLVHLLASGTVIDVDINRVRYRCNNEFWFVSNGEAGAPGQLGVTLDGGTTWTLTPINTLANADNATDLVFVGDYVVIASPDDGVSYALISDILDGTTTPFTASAGFTADFPNVLAVTNDGVIWAAGDGGFIWRSTDGGFSFTEIDDGGTTANNFLSIAVSSDDLVWFGAANGDLVRYRRGALSVVAVGTVTDDLISLAAPAGRDELFVGTDAGEIHRTTNASGNSPLFVEMQFPDAGTGRIEDLQFTGFRGAFLFVLQTNGTGDSRLLRDLSGGALAQDVEIIGSYADPDNDGIVSVALRNANDGISVGDVSSAQGFIGKVTS